MLRSLIETANRFDRPAVVLWGMRVYANRAADREFGRAPIRAARPQLEAAIDACARRGEPVEVALGDRRLCILPISAAGDGMPIGIALAEPTPADLHRLFTETVGAQSFLVRVLHMLPEIVLTARADGRIDFYNRRWSEYVGADVFPKSLRELTGSFHPDDAERFLAALEDHFELGLPFSQDVRLCRDDASSAWHALRVQPARLFRASRRTKWLVTLNDVDEVVKARLWLERSEARLRLLAEAGRRLSESLDVRSVVKTACEQAVRGFAVAAGIELTIEGEPGSLSVEPPEALMSLARHLRGPEGRSGAVTPVLDAEAGALRTFVRFALPGRDRRLGTLVLAFSDPDAPRDDEELRTLQEFARRVALALDNARLYGRDHRVALTLQEALLAKQLPQLDGAAFDALYLAGDEEAAVGGDWYDVFRLRDGRIGLSIGDVAGHGLHAATVMGMIRQTIRTACHERASPAFALERANQALFTDEPTMVTALVAILDPVFLRLTYVNAGHPPGLVAEADGTVTPLPGHAAALGILPDWDAADQATTLLPSEALVLYTDGLIEFTRDADRGEARLQAEIAAWIRSGRPGGVTGLTRAVFGPNARTDDTAILVATFPAPEVLDVTLPAVPTRVTDFRRALHRFASARGLEEEPLFSLLVASGEAVNNAITHAYGPEGGTVRLRASAEGGTIRVEVHDSGRWQPPNPIADSGAEHGRGLELMHALAEEVAIDHDGDGTHVRLTFFSEASRVAKPRRLGAPALAAREA